jgi:hypothetical protein
MVEAPRSALASFRGLARLQLGKESVPFLNAAWKRQSPDGRSGVPRNYT